MAEPDAWAEFRVGGSSVTADGRPQITVNPIRPGYDKAISSIESGGNYRAVGPPTRDGDRALGKYQIMGKNIGPWSKEVLGEELTPTQFMATPEIQDKIFNAKFGTYVEKYGPEGAAKAWFAGEKGMNDPNRRDVLGTSVADYGRKFNAAMGPQQAQAAPVPAPAPAGDPWAEFRAPAAPPPQQSIVDQRYAETPPPANAPKLQAGLEERAAELTTGPRTSPAANMVISHGNLLSAASQGSTPHVDAYKGKLLSTEVHEDDGGNLHFRDPQTGAMVKTDNTKHVVLRDPADNRVKVFARGEATNEGAATGVARTLSRGVMVGAPTARPAIGATNKIVPKASDVFSTSKAPYREFDRIAAQTPVDGGGVLVDRIQNALDTARLPKEVAEQVHKTVALVAPASKPVSQIQRLEAEMNRLPLPENSTPSVSLDHLQHVKQAVGKLFKSADPNVRAGAGVATKEINLIIREASQEAADSLSKADAIHSTARTMQDLQRASDVAGLRSRRGASATDRMVTYLSGLVEKSAKGERVPLKPDEIQAARSIVEGTLATKTFRAGAEMKGLKPILGSLGAAPFTGGATLAIPVLGAVSNKLAAILTGRQIDRLKELVAKRSPEYAAAVKKAVERFEGAQIELMEKPSPGGVAKLVWASRALSAGLTKDGISITSGELLKAIQGPIKSAADEDQQSVQRRPGE